MSSDENPIEIRWLSHTEIEDELPIIAELNPEIPLEVLRERLVEMLKRDFRCVGAFIANKCVGISGVWIGYRFWCGKFLDVDNVIVTKEYRSAGIGKKMMDWIHRYAEEQQINLSVLDAYVWNDQAHKFYMNQGYKILGYHFARKFIDLRKNGLSFDVEEESSSARQNNSQQEPPSSCGTFL
ncbi:MAG: GNAT family N-acetyltransferase [Pirellulaceae bacterium]|nr:GNAT family N-acetyltransferase [Pirellulaceae bacterium]